MSEVTAAPTDERDSAALMAILRASARRMPPGRLVRDERWVEAATIEEFADRRLELEGAHDEAQLHVRIRRFARPLRGRQD